ncbi:MAG: hypothetical protein ABSG21_06120 [Spirochaetia bacterium]|jgi:hypothetical protein
MKCRIEASKPILLAILVSALLLSASGMAGAQTNKTVHFKGVNYEVTGNFFPVGDPADGHFVGISIRRGLSTFETGEIGAASSVEYIDVTKGVGTTSGYATITFDDGSSYTTKIANNFSVGPKGLVVASVKTEYIKGTGRFEGIKGTEAITARQINSTKDFAGFAELEGTATYTLPSK